MRFLNIRHAGSLARCLRGIALWAALMAPLAASAALDDQYKAAGGVAAYLGIMPAELIKGHPKDHAESTMHRGRAGGRHEYHVVVALFDATSGARIEDAVVQAQMAAVGLAADAISLEPMSIASTVTYGGFITLPNDLYTIKVTVRRPGAPQPVILEFKFDHRPAAGR